MTNLSGSAIFSESRRSRRAPVVWGLALAAILVGGLAAHQLGVRIVRVDHSSSTAGSAAFVSTSELARIEQQYQERLEALRAQLQDEREQMRDSQRTQAAEVAAFHRIDKSREIAKEQLLFARWQASAAVALALPSELPELG